MQVPVRYATSQDVYFRMIVRGSTDFAGSSDWTPATGDVKLSIDGGALANTTNLPTAVGKSWKLTLTTGETTGGVLMLDIIDQGTKAVEDQGLDFFTFGNASAYVPRDLYSSNPPGIKKNTALNNYMFRMSDSATGDPKTGLTVTAERSLDGAAFAACANAVSEIGSGWYKITLAAGDVNGDTVALKFTATNAKQLDELIVTEP
ncbi:MAG TPA: hypothetical protein VFD85_01475 [Gemmatimonadales bacterium]|nr:hypothetical protein [Gemmatimonadales bacterium]